MRAVIDTGTSDIREAFIQAKMEPSCGWPWLEEHMRKTLPEQSITVLRDGKVVLKADTADKQVTKTMKQIMRDGTT